MIGFNGMKWKWNGWTYGTIELSGWWGVLHLWAALLSVLSVADVDHPWVMQLILAAGVIGYFASQGILSLLYKSIATLSKVWRFFCGLGLAIAYFGMLILPGAF